jgi:hypothetical protein
MTEVTVLSGDVPKVFSNYYSACFPKFKMSFRGAWRATWLISDKLRSSKSSLRELST